MVRRLLRMVGCTALLSAAACASGPGPGQSGYPFNLDGTYTGRVFFAGEPFDATVELDTRGGGAVQGSFKVRTPVLIDGVIEGVVVGDLLRVRVLYGSPGGCDGSMEGVLSIEPGGDSFEGPVTVRDCGDPIAGRLAFERGAAPTAGAPESTARGALDPSTTSVPERAVADDRMEVTPCP